MYEDHYGNRAFVCQRPGFEPLTLVRKSEKKKKKTSDFSLKFLSPGGEDSHMNATGITLSSEN